MLIAAATRSCYTARKQGCRKPLISLGWCFVEGPPTPSASRHPEPDRHPASMVDRRSSQQFERVEEVGDLACLLFVQALGWQAVDGGGAARSEVDDAPAGPVGADVVADEPGRTHGLSPAPASQERTRASGSAFCVTSLTTAIESAPAA